MGYNLSPKVLIKLENQLQQLSDNRNSEISWTLDNIKDAKNFLFLLRSALKQIEDNDSGPYKGIYGKTRLEGLTVTFLPKKKFATTFIAPDNTTSLPEIRTFTDLFIKPLPSVYVQIEFPNLVLKEPEKELLKSWMNLHSLELISDLPYKFKKSS